MLCRTPRERKSKKKGKIEEKREKSNGIGRCDTEMVVTSTQSTLARALLYQFAERNCLIEGKNRRIKRVEDGEAEGMRERDAD